MAIVQNQLFKTPTGQTYAPAQSIERSFDKTNQRIYGIMQRESDRLKAEQERFAEMYGNLGEIESALQTQYAGIMQQGMDSTVNFLKEAYKEGKSLADPELQMELGQRVGRLRGGMANADRNRQQLKEAAELIKSDPAIIDKATAMNSLMQRYSDPDFLISQNSFDAGSYLDQFVNPQKVFEQAWKSIPTTGEFSEQYTDDQGNLRERYVAYNDLISREQAYNPDGSLNLQIPPEFAQSVRSGEFGERIIDQTLKIANERYSDLPADLAFTRALKDGMSAVASGNFKDRVVRSAYDIEKDQRAEARQNRSLDRQDAMLNLQYERLKKQGASEAKAQKEAEEYQSLYDEFVEGIQTGSKGTLGKYELPGGNVRNIDWITEKDAIALELPSFNDWKSLSKAQRTEMLTQYVPEDQIPTKWGGLLSATDSKEAHDLLIKEATKNASDRPVGIQFETKMGTVQGQSQWERQTETWKDDPTKIPNVFEQLQNLKSKTKGSLQPTPEPPGTEDEKDLTVFF